MLNMKLGYNRPNGFFGRYLKLSYESPGLKAKTDLDLLYSKTFMCSLKQLYLSLFRPKSSKLSIKSYALAVFHIRPCLKKKGHGAPTFINITIFVGLRHSMLHTKFKAIDQLVLEKKIFKGFSMYGLSGPLGLDKFSFPCSHKLSHET